MLVVISVVEPDSSVVVIVVSTVSTAVVSQSPQVWSMAGVVVVLEVSATGVEEVELTIQSLQVCSSVVVVELVVSATGVEEVVVVLEVVSATGVEEVVVV
jgi:hypothetical protein